MAQKTSIRDVALHTGRITHRRGTKTPNAAHFHSEVHLHGDLWIGPLPELTERILDASEPAGENSLQPVRQWGSRYAFIRAHAPSGPRSIFNFDPDKALSTCLQLARLVRPTTIGTAYGARLVERAGRPLEIIPARHRGFGVSAFVVDKDANWIRDQDIKKIREMLAAFDPASLPRRITRALWYYDYVTKTQWVDVRWQLLITALEALVHIDERRTKGGLGPTAQVRKRLISLSALIPGVQLSEDQIRESYEYRSGIAHGLGIGPRGWTKTTLGKYLRTERAIRSILQSCIMDSRISAIFASDESIRQNL